MSDRLPMLGTPEFYQACAEADKHIHGDNYDKYTKPARQKIVIPKITSNKAYPPEFQIRGLELMINEKVPPKKAALQLSKEVGRYIAHSTVKNWLFWHRKRERASK